MADDLGCGFVRDCLDRPVVDAQSPRAPPNFVKSNSGLLNLYRRAGAPESTLAGRRPTQCAYGSHPRPGDVTAPREFSQGNVVVRISRRSIPYRTAQSCCTAMPVMSDVASICSEFGIAVVPPARSRKEARLWKLARLRRCKDCCPTGVSHTCGTFFHRLLTAQGMNGRSPHR